jgi:Thioredoxin reductase
MSERPSDATPAEETPDTFGAYPRLDTAQIESLAADGARRSTRAGDVLIAEGKPPLDFIVITAGIVATYDAYGTPQQRRIGVHGPGRFLGELGVLAGHAAFVSTVALTDGEIIAVPADRLRQRVARDTQLGDLILRAYLQRRSILIGLGSGFRIVGSRYSPDTRRLRDFAARNRLPHRWIDLDTDDDAEALLTAIGVAAADTPIAIWRNENVLRNPTNAHLARLVGLPPPLDAHNVCDLLVVGAGPAGLAACVYGASEGLHTVAVEAIATGGQAESSPLIENYLGFPAGLSGAELAERASIQAGKFGALVSVPAAAVGLTDDDGYHAVALDDGSQIRARTVLVATGAQYRKPDIEGLGRLEGVSVYYAATEIEARLCAGDPVAVIGGGNSAGQAALFLARHAAHVTLLVRSGDIGQDMSRYLVDQLVNHPGVAVLTHTEARELVGDRSLDAVVVENNQTGDRSRIDARSLFVFIGAAPGTRWLAHSVALDEHGFVQTGTDVESPPSGSGTLLLESSRTGVFAAGDVRAGSVKRVASAVGDGAIAVRMVHERLRGEAG